MAISIRDQGQYTMILRALALRYDSEPVDEFDGAGLYRFSGWNDWGERAKCTLSKIG